MNINSVRACQPVSPFAVLVLLASLLAHGTSYAQACDATVLDGESIQAAIDAADPGDTICVEAGYYEDEQAGFRDLFIDKSINLIGAGSGDTVVGLRTVTNGVEVRGVNVSDVLIEGFTFTHRDGATEASSFNLRFGETATTFDSLVLRDVEVSWASGRNVMLDGNGTYHDVVIENSSFHDGGVWGFSANGIVNSLTVTNSDFDDNGWNHATNGIGFDIDSTTQAANVIVSGGSFSGNRRVGINLTNLRDSAFSGFTANGNGGHGVNLFEFRGASSNVTFEDCTASNNNDGIQIGRQDSFTVDDVTVEGCELNDNARAGIHVWGVPAVQSVISEGFAFLDNHAEGNQRGIWVEAFPTQGLEITGNTTIDSGLHGITVFVATGATIADNIATNNTATGVVLLSSQDVAITNNDASDNANAGILVGGANVNITGNAIVGNPGTSHPGGLTLWVDATNVTATGNLFKGNGIGIWAHGDVGADNAAHLNCIEGNDEGAVNLSSTQGLNAINNWWGAADGPSGDGPGSGDSVNGDIAFDPWLTDSTNTPCPPPGVTVTKTSATTEVPETGDSVSYTFTVENTGEVSFAITSLTDDQFGTLAGDAGCQVGTELDPTESCSFDAAFAVPAGTTGETFVNTFTALVTGDDDKNDSDSDSHTVTYTDVPPEVTVTKTSATTEVPETGGQVTYTFTVMNTGEVSFTITTLTDDQFGTLAGDAGCQVGTELDPTESCSFDAAFAVPAGTTGETFVNTFTALVTDADGTTDSDSDDHTVTYTDVPPEVTVTKTSATTEVPETGDTVSYTFTVENTGAVSFTITSLTDDQFGTLAGDADCQVGTELDPTESCSFDAAFDVPAGTTGETFVNTFTALVTDADDTTDSDSDDHTVTYTDVAPEVTVTKTSATTEVPETGDTVSYTFTVENTGAVSFAITSLTDDQFGALVGDAGCQVGTELDPEGSCSFDAAFDVPAGTTGETFVNTFTALVTDTDGTTDSDSDDHTVTYTDVAPEVTVTKTSATTEVPETGDTVSYTFTVENTGAVSFTITSLTDDQFGALAGDAGCQVGTELDPTESCSFNATFDIPAGTTGETFVNTFSALVTDADGTTDSDSDDHTVTYTVDEPPEIITIESIPIPTISRIGLLFMLLLMMGTGLWFVRR